jgi:TonB family protein
MTRFLLQNLLLYSLQLLLVVLAAGLVAALARLRNPRIELAYLQGVLAVGLLLPFLQPWQALVLDSPVEATQALVGASQSSRGEETSGGGVVLGFPTLAWVLLGGAGIRFAWLAVGFLRLARYRKDSQALPFDPLFVPALEQRLGSRASLRLSSKVRGPVTFGWRRPVILLPERFLDFEPELRRAILCHELLHVARRDWVFTVCEESIRALLWFHPAIWWLIGRIHLVREQLVDREAIRLTESEEPYLRALLAMAGHHLQPDLAPATLFLRKHHLDQRMSAVVRKESPMSRVRSMARLGLMSSVVATAVWLAASTFPLQAVPQEAPDPGRAAAVRVWSAQPGVVQQGENYRVHALRGIVEQSGGNLLQSPIVFYSPEALQKRVEGRVVLELSVDEEGRVYDAMVISGPQELRRPALMSALHWQYSKDMPLPTKLAVTIRFELPQPQDSSPQSAAASGGQSPKRIRVGSAVQHARLLRSFPPQYPALARQARVEGNVELVVSINAAGGVERVDVVQGHRLLIPAAIEAVKQWEYRPTMLNGVPVEVETNVDVGFSLGGGLRPAP